MTSNTRYALLAAATIGGVLISTSSPLHAAATLGLVGRTQVSNNNADFHLSVYDGSAGFDDSGNGGTTTYTFGDGTVLDYRFFNSIDAGVSLNTYADGSNNIIQNASAPDANLDPQAIAWTEIWTTTDPAGFTSTPNFNGAANTFARAANVTGTIDISTLSSGNLYFMHGTFVNQWTLTLTMSGSGGSDIIALDNQTTNGPNTNYGWVTEFSFADAAGYDTITYTYTNQDADGSRARFMGVVIDGTVIPEPSAALLGLLGSLILLRRRR